MTRAQEMLKMMKEKGVPPNARTYNILINGYGRDGQFARCFRILEEMEQLGIKPNEISYENCLYKNNKLPEAEIFLRDIGDRGIPPNAQIYNMLFVKRPRCLEMLMRNLSPNRVIYNTFIRCHAKYGDAQKAFTLHQEMVEKGIHNRMSYNSLIMGHCREGNVLQAIQHFFGMEARGIVPISVTYSILIEGHCRSNDFCGAYDWCKEMLAKGFVPSVSICNELITGLENEGKLQQAELLGHELSEKGSFGCIGSSDLSAVA
ncbi:Pentatricopeptide repeat-containing protein [Thalictrum thalictroides]|uniref:Pentatricopeptide repeat-containing protein n=1 Tax=Thalictrum thalictroides TaxID=46969 RepID=A0A7J6VST0_THATH|nr:Pentatricopeptide repeat-containing protein [Thalictrum thalictroides]